MQKSYRVLNISCGGCAKTIKNTLLEDFGEVDVDLESEPRIVSLSIESEEAEKLFREKMRSLGYPLADENIGTLQMGGLKAKSFVSCSVGKFSK
jgi:copper chaperone